MMTFYKIRSEIHGKTTGSLNTGNSDLPIDEVIQVSECLTEEVPKV